MNQFDRMFAHAFPADPPEGDLDDFIFSASEDCLISDR